MHSTFNLPGRKRLAAFASAVFFALVAAGCHNNNLSSGYGIGWVTVTDEPGDFAVYIVTIDDITLTGKANGVITAVATPEVVDFTKLRNLSELWASASIPNDTYTTATLTLDYTSAQVAVMINGVPTAATVIDPSTGNAATTITVTVTLDPVNQLTIIPTYASTDAKRLAVDLDLAATNTIDLTTSPPTVTVRPFVTFSTSAADTNLIRVRGPLINTSLDTAATGFPDLKGTYSVYVRPFFDEQYTAGTLSLFNNPNTIYTINGSTYVGSAGIQALSQTSSGSTETAAYTTFQPTSTPSAVAGIFTPAYVIAGSTLEDFYTYGLEGDVIARNGNVLTLRGATLFANAAQEVQFEAADSTVTVGPTTIVTEDDVAGATGLGYQSIAVGQHITARGIYSLSAAGDVQLDSTGDTATNTGSVRIQSTHLWGSLLSSATGSLTLNLQTIDDYPAGVYNFAGNGATAAQDSNAASYVVNTGSLALPAGLAAADPLWIDGFASPFGSAPPDFNAIDLNAESSVPATLLVKWSSGTLAPFSSLTDTGMSIDLSNASLVSAIIRVGPESIDITTLAASPQIVPQAAVPSGTGLPDIFMPLFGVGSTANGISVFNTYSSFVTQLNTTFTGTSATAAVLLDARGTYNRATNTFSAATINVVL